MVSLTRYTVLHISEHIGFSCLAWWLLLFCLATNWHAQSSRLVTIWLSVQMIDFNHIYRGGMVQPFIVSSKPFLFCLSSPPSHSFQKLMDSFNNSDITLVDIALMQHFFGHLRSSSGTKALPSHHAMPLLSTPPPSQPPPSHISVNQTVQQSNQGLIATQLSVNVPITEPNLNTTISQALSTSHHDIHHATSAHPSHPTPYTSRAVSTSQPFLGFNKLSVGMTGQVNQWQLASAAAHLPRPPHLVNCSSHSNQEVCHGLVVHPPSLPHGPTLEDCVYVEPNTNVTIFIPPSSIIILGWVIQIYYHRIEYLGNQWLHTLQECNPRNRGISWMLWVHSVIWCPFEEAALWIHQRYSRRSWKQWA